MQGRPPPMDAALLRLPRLIAVPQPRVRTVGVPDLGREADPGGLLRVPVPKGDLERVDAACRGVSAMHTAGSAGPWTGMERRHASSISVRQRHGATPKRAEGTREGLYGTWGQGKALGAP